MKALSLLTALMLIPTLTAQAADKAGAMEGYLPTDGSLQRGAEVRLIHSETIQEPVRKLNEALAKLPEDKVEDRNTFIKEFSANLQPSYSAAIWPDRADYDQFIEAWKKARINPVTEVAVGLQKVDDNNWRVLSVTVDAQTQKQVPLTITALRYNAEKNEWISNNGVLKASSYSAPDTSIFGAQTGTEWVLEKKDELAILRESLRASRTTDGKYVYLAYSLVERSAVTGGIIAQGDYLLRFPVQTTGANVGTPGQR